jgi:protein-disulfide isomerase
MKKYILLLSLFFLASCSFSAATTEEAEVQTELQELNSALEEMVDELQEEEEDQKEAPLFTEDDPILGDKDASIQLVIFSDKQCPYCASFASVIDEIKTDWIDTGKVVVQYRDFPLKGHHHAAKAALAAWAAQNQNKYWEYHSLLYSSQKQWAILEDKPFMDVLITYAEELSLNLAQFRSDLQSEIGKEEARQDLKDALALGVEGTPTFFINGRKVKGNRDKDTLETWFKAILNEDNE